MSINLQTLCQEVGELSKKVGVFIKSQGEKFSSEQIEWVQHHHPYRWAIWHEPVLYDISENAVWMRADYGHFGSAFYPLVFDLYRRSFTVIAERLQRPQPDFINGRRT